MIRNRVISEKSFFTSRLIKRIKRALIDIVSQDFRVYIWAQALTGTTDYRFVGLNVTYQISSIGLNLK